MPYISEPVPYDAGAVEDEIRAQLVAEIPGLQIDPLTPLDIMVRTLAPLIAENRQMLSEQLAESFMYFGEKVLRLPRDPATSATGTAEFVVSHTNGYEIPAGTEISLDKGDGTRQGFETRVLGTIPNGDDTIDLEIVAVTPGAAGTGVSGDALVEQPFLADIAIVTVAAPTTGGGDEEDASGYLNRLADTTPLLAFTLVNPEDFERDARNQPNIDRARIIPLYDADTSTPGVGGHFTVAVESGGADPGSGVRDALEARQQAMVPPNVIVHVVGPNHNDIDVVFAGKSLPGWDAADVEARSEQAVLDFLNPARFALPDTGDVPLWEPVDVVRMQDIITVLNNVAGFSHYTSLTINGGTSDVTLTGIAPLPAPVPTSSASGTITTP